MFEPTPQSLGRVAAAMLDLIHHLRKVVARWCPHRRERLLQLHFCN
jgi:hypothetical protein